MNTIKVAITVPEKVVIQVDSISRKLGFSRSKYITLALKEKLERETKQKIRTAYDEVFSDDSVCEEQLATSRWFQGTNQSEGQEW